MKYYKKGSKTLLTSKSSTRKRKAEVSEPLKKYVKNAILKQEETHVRYSEVSASARVAGSFIKHRVGAAILKGTDMGLRAGAEIYMTYIKLQVNIRLRAHTPANARYSGTGRVRVMLLEDKEPDVADASDTIAARLFESESNTNTPVAYTTTGNYLQTIKKINRMRWTVHHDEVLTLKADTDANGNRLSDRTVCKTIMMPVNRKFRFRDNSATSPRAIDPCYYVLWFYEDDSNDVLAQFAETITFREYFKDA